MASPAVETTGTGDGAPDAPPSADQEALARRKRLILLACCLAQFLVILDLSIVNVALPTIQSALRISASDLQWVIDAYAILFAGFLMLMGRASDLIGQRRVFVTALAAFGVASLACGLAQSSGTLIVARGAQGLAGAGMAAASLAIITATFEPGPERARAIALWGAMNGAGGATGVLAGGVLTDALSWRWIFLINVPVAIGGAVAASRFVAEHTRRAGNGFDVPGALLLTVGLLIATYGGVTAGSEGFGSADALIPIIIGTVLLQFFPLVEKRVKHPLVPPGSLTGQVKAINVIVVLFSSSLFAMWFASSLYLQQVLALSPTEAGLCFLPMALAIFAVARPAGKLTVRVGAKPVLTGGLVLLALGLALMSRIGAGGSAIQYIVLPGVLVAIGIGLSVVSSTIAATQFARPDQAGLTSSLVNTSRQVGGGLGLAVLLSIATQHTAALIGDGNGVDQSLTDGFSLAYIIAACLVAVAAVLAFTLVPGAEEAPQRAAGRRVLVAVGVLAVVWFAVDAAIPRSEAQPIGKFKLAGTYSFVTAPELHPPKLQVQLPRKADNPLPGYIMAANFLDLTKPPLVGQSGPMMLDGDLEPVFFKPLDTDLVAANLDTYVYRGKPVLGWWEGDVEATGEVNSGTIRLVDQQYKPVATIQGEGDWIISLHALQIRGNLAYVSANRNEEADLSDEGGVSHGVLVNSALQAYDIRTGKLVYTWEAKDHVAEGESETQPPPNGFPWDAYHINALQLVGPDRALVSFRNTSAGYMIDLKSGKIIWRLGGKRSDFAIPPAARFEWQHDLEMVGPDTVTLFDNHCCEITGAGEFLDATGPSRALELKLDQSTKTASVVNELDHGSSFQSQYMGNRQSLPNGHTFVGWGQVPFLTEYDEKGKIVFDGALPTPNLTYRSRVRKWVGRPATPPAAALEDGKVYVSWNGATQVRRWRVIAGSRTVAQSARKGFETAIPVPSGAQVTGVQALDAGGRVIGTSKAPKPAA